MKKFAYFISLKKLIIILFALLLFSGCDNKKSGFTINSYPMAVGSEWVYNRELTFNEFQTDNLKNVMNSDTLNHSVRVWIEKDTLINDKVSVKKFRSHEKKSEVYGTEFLFRDYEGIKCYAYYPGSGLMGFVKNQSQLKLPHAFPFGGLFSIPQFKTNGLVFEDPPTLNLKLPLLNDIIWTYRHSSEELSVQIDKRVVDAESVKAPAGTFECFKIKYEYSSHPSFENVEIYDWIAEEGLIKRKISADSIVFTNQAGDSVGFGTSVDTYSLKALELE